MRWVCAVAAILLAMSADLCWAQEQIDPDQLKKMYDDTLVQLRAAQDRKKELAGENEKLLAKVAELQRQLEEARRQASEAAEKTFYLRAHHAAWSGFLRFYPAIRTRWEVFIENGLFQTPASSQQKVTDPDWPLSAAG